ncbi:MAG: ABC transporter substrate-binding protein [Candidatus Thorarchaeota archaeon]
MDRKIMAVAVVAIIAVVGVAGIFVFMPPAEDTIKIGVLVPLTGNAAPGGGIPIRDGIKLAAEEKGTVLGKTIELVYGDIFDGPAGATEAERLITVEGVQAICGSYGTSQTLTATEKCNEYNIPFIDTTQWDDQLSARNYSEYFRICAKASTYAETYAEIISDFWVDELNLTAETINVAVVNDDWSTYVVNPMIDHLNASGIEIVYHSQNPWDIADFTPVIEQLKLIDVDILVLEHIVPSAVLFRQQMLALNFTPSVVFPMGVGWAQSPFLDAIGTENVDGIVSWEWPSPSMNFSKAADFREAFNTRFGYIPTSTHPMMGYSGMMFLLDMIEEAGVYEKSAIADACRAADIEEGYYPMYWGVSFDENGDNTRCDQHGLFQWQDGVLECVWPEDWATADWRRPWAA